MNDDKPSLDATKYHDGPASVLVTCPRIVYFSQHYPFQLGICLTVAGANCYPKHHDTKFQSSLEEWEKPKEKILYMLSVSMEVVPSVSWQLPK